MGGLSSIGIYLYEDVYYRQWITEIALAFYEGRQDEFVWLDLVRQFRNPEKQQILPMNFTKEIIDEVSVLYQEAPIYQVIDTTGKVLKEDQQLWEEIMRDSRYLMLMDKLDRWTRLLGTVLVKVSFVDPDSGQLMKSNEGGRVQLDLMHGGIYDVRHGASPYYITELLIGFGTKFGGWAHDSNSISGAGVAATIPSPSNYGINDAAAKRGLVYNDVKNVSQLGKVNRIYWGPDEHVQLDDKGQGHRVKNPYGIIPAIPFFNSDPAHYYFLPINEPLIYANHSLNMRMTDLNHIAKFQSFGVPVVKGIERSTSLRQGRPVDDFNQLKGGAAQSRFGGVTGVSGFGASGQYRTYDTGFGIFKDGNADANALGMSLGPDTAIAVGEKGDFKFAHPSADIIGLVKTIHSISDMVRVNHGLRPKYEQSLPSSGFSLMMDKIGVLEDNIRRSRLFKEREQQLFQVVKKLWNTHYSKSGDKRFSDEARLEITYKIPEFPVDPKTKKEDLMMESKLLDSGDIHIISKLYPHMSETEIKSLIKKRRKDKEDQTIFEAELMVKAAEITSEASGPVDDKKHKYVKKAGDSGKYSYIYEDDKGKEHQINRKYSVDDVAKPKIDNRAKHSEDSSKQKNTNGDIRT